MLIALGNTADVFTIIRFERAKWRLVGESKGISSFWFSVVAPVTATLSAVGTLLNGFVFAAGHLLTWDLPIHVHIVIMPVLAVPNLWSAVILSFYLNEQTMKVASGPAYRQAHPTSQFWERHKWRFRAVLGCVGMFTVGIYLRMTSGFTTHTLTAVLVSLGPCHGLTGY